MSYGVDVEEQIRNMGYALATPIVPPIPSLYELGDKTILSVLARINHILTSTTGSGNNTINHSMDIRVFAPHRHKTRKTIRPNQQPNIIEPDIKCVRLREEFNDYTAGDGIVVSAKAVVGQVAKTDAYDNTGEPVYIVNALPAIKVVDKRLQSFASGTV